MLLNHRVGLNFGVHQFSGRPQRPVFLPLVPIAVLRLECLVNPPSFDRPLCLEHVGMHPLLESSKRLQTLGSPKLFLHPLRAVRFQNQVIAGRCELGSDFLWIVLRLERLIGDLRHDPLKLCSLTPRVNVQNPQIAENRDHIVQGLSNIVTVPIRVALDESMLSILVSIANNEFIH